MQRDLVIKGRSLGGSSDLTLLAKIKPGFIDSIESVTYKTRIKRVLESLHGARMVSHEQHEARLLSDSIERVGMIQSVRVAVLEPEDKVLLAVTFDGSWQSYIRVLWDKVGTLLDLIFCGTVDYVTSNDHSFDEWLEWAYRVQIETGFFYGPPDFTARDVFYHRRVERMRLRGPDRDDVPGEVLEMRTVLPSAEMAVGRIIDSGTPLTEDDPHVAPIQPARMVGQRLRIGLRGLAALYRLTDLHRPFTPDGDVLHRAARDLLREFVTMHDGGLATDQFQLAHGRFARQLDWLFPECPVKPRRVPKPADAGPEEIPRETLRRLQGGIVRSYMHVTHGLIVMVVFDKPGAASKFFDWANKHVTTGDVDCKAVARSGGRHATVFCNVSVTVAGLRASGLTEDEIDLFPEEFRQGMAARAGLLGDVRNNHPRRWRRPRRFRHMNVDEHEGLDAEGIALPDSFEVVDLDTVHAIVQFQTRAGGAALAADALSDRRHPLRAVLRLFRRANRDLQVLAVQSTRRRFDKDDDVAAIAIREHFGYRDGFGQPEIERILPAARNSLNRIHLGEMFHGHSNATDFPPDPLDSLLPPAIRNRLAWLNDGSFLVVRKYRQFVERMEQSIEASIDKKIDGPQRVQAIEAAYGKLMGRRRDGSLLVPGALPNNFVYSADPQGQACPLHAHIRLANPRIETGGTTRPPRIMRCGMSYGPKYEKDGKPANRGLVFMAYNANISEQYEVIQRWLTGGNSTGSSSGQSCPIVGVPDNGLSRFHRFEEVVGKKVVTRRIRLEGETTLFEEPPVLSRLEWGMYLFAPAPSVLRRLGDAAARALHKGARMPAPWQVERGRARLVALEVVRRTEGDAAALTAWKTAIEDPESIDRLEAAALWAAIRADHGGLLKTPYGILVANRELAHEVLMNVDHRYSVEGQLARMSECFGEVYLGMDDGDRYREESQRVNDSIVALTSDPKKKKALFRAVVISARRVLNRIARQARQQGERVDDVRYEVSVDVREILDEVLADLAECWFGIHDGPKTPLFRRGSPDWSWKVGQPPLYPGHFTALSRYIFQPNPGGTPRELAQSYGRALKGAMDAFVEFHRERESLPCNVRGEPAPIAKAVFEHLEWRRDADYVSKTIVGVLMGLNPTIIGAVLNVVRELQRDGRFDALRAALGGKATFDHAHSILGETIRGAARMRPMPQSNWRTALTSHRLHRADGTSVPVQQGDVLVVATVSATQQSLEDNVDDGFLMFGGDRTAPVHPLHACPGRGAGWEVIVGTIAAILARRETMRQGVGPLAFVLEGAIARKSVRNPQPIKPEPAGPPGPAKARRRGRSGLVIAWGDSWLDYSFLGTELIKDLRDWLETFGYRVPRDFCQWTTWTKIETMAANTGPFCRFLSLQIQNALPAHQPLAVLLSGGGNDSTGNALEALLVDRISGNGSAPPAEAFDRDRLGLHIAALKGHYQTVIRAITSTLETEARLLPIIVHGYDHPFPRGKEFAGWLREPFERKGYRIDDEEDCKAATKAMRQLIDKFNTMLAELQAESQGAVRHVNLTNTIANEWKGAVQAGWKNDLHPTGAAFGYLALALDRELRALSSDRADQSNRIRTRRGT